MYSIWNARQILQTDHTLARKILLYIEFVYQFFQLLFTYFGLVSLSGGALFETKTANKIGQLLSCVLLHCWLSCEQGVGPVRAQHWQIYFHDSSVRVRLADCVAIYPVDG